MISRNIRRGVRGDGAALSLIAVVAGAVGTSAVSAQSLPKAVATIPAGFQDWTEHNHDGNHIGASAETDATGQLIFASAAVSTGQFFISSGGNGDL